MRATVRKELNSVLSEIRPNAANTQKKANEPAELAAPGKSQKEDAIVSELRSREEVRTEPRAFKLARSVSNMINRVGGQAVLAQANQTSSEVKTFLS